MKFIISNICCLLIFTCVLGRKIFKGTQAKDEQFPYQVSLQTERRHHFCGASILNPTTILTAAHCFCDNPTDMPKNIIVLAGTINKLANGQSSKVEKIICHEKYSSTLSRNDIALLKLKTRLKYTNSVLPITLPTSEVADNEMLNFSGWGNTGFHSEGPISLQSIELRKVNWINCAAMFGRYHWQLNKDALCAKAGGRGSGACYGDSGGPLADEDYIQYGIASYAFPDCAQGEPDVFTSVFYHKNWILWNMR